MHLTLEYLITVHNGKLDFIWVTKKDDLMLLNRFNAFGINLNAQHLYGMTHFDVWLSETYVYRVMYFISMADDPFCKG